MLEILRWLQFSPLVKDEVMEPKPLIFALTAPNYQLNTFFGSKSVSLFKMMSIPLVDDPF